MIVGTHTARTSQDQINLVLRASKDLDFSIQQKAERMRQGPGRGYDVIGAVEQIIFEVVAENSISDLRSLGGELTGRRIYWPEPSEAPVLARTRPEEDLIFTHAWKRGLNGLVSLPNVSADPKEVVPNPYKVDQHGASHLKKLENLQLPKMQRQRIEKIANAKSGRFLVCHPIAQIIAVIAGKNRNTGRFEMQYAAFGSHRMPLSSLSGWDDRKMSLLVDPYTGEAYFSGGRYQMHAPDVKV